MTIPIQNCQNLTLSKLHTREYKESHFCTLQTMVEEQFLSSTCNLPYANQVVCISSEESLSICRPCQGDAFSWFCLSTQTYHFWLELVHNRFRFQVPDLDAWSSCSTQPVSVWTESQRVDDVTTVQCIQMLSFIEIPQHSFAIFTTRSTQRSIWRDSHRVDIATVTIVIGFQFAVGQIPHLHHFIPATGHNDGILRVG